MTFWRSHGADPGCECPDCVTKREIEGLRQRQRQAVNRFRDAAHDAVRAGVRRGFLLAAENPDAVKLYLETGELPAGL